MVEPAGLDGWAILNDKSKSLYARLTPVFCSCHAGLAKMPETKRGARLRSYSCSILLIPLMTPFAARPARALEIHVLSAGAVQEAEKALTTGFETESGHHVRGAATAWSAIRRTQDRLQAMRTYLEPPVRKPAVRRTV